MKTFDELADKINALSWLQSTQPVKFIYDGEANHVETYSGCSLELDSEGNPYVLLSRKSQVISVATELDQKKKIEISLNIS